MLMLMVIYKIHDLYLLFLIFTLDIAQNRERIKDGVVLCYFYTAQAIWLHNFPCKIKKSKMPNKIARRTCKELCQRYKQTT